MPIGYCCSLCNQYEEHKACKHEDELIPESKKDITLLKSEIKENLLHVTLEKEGKEFKLKIDLNSYLK